jgi:hypothetical protein
MRSQAFLVNIRIYKFLETAKPDKQGKSLIEERFHRVKEGTQRTQRLRKIFAASFAGSKSGFLCVLFLPLCPLWKCNPVPKDLQRFSYPFFSFAELMAFCRASALMPWSQWSK